MPDISMCKNRECPSKEKCYRFKAKPNPHRQSYCFFEPKKGEDKCDYFYEVRDSDNIKAK